MEVMNMGCGSCGPTAAHAPEAPACCGRPMTRQGDQYVCAVSKAHTAPASGGHC